MDCPPFRFVIPDQIDGAERYPPVAALPKGGVAIRLAILTIASRGGLVAFVGADVLFA